MDNDVLIIKFDDSKIPEFKEIRGKQWVYFGEDNMYPDYLVKLFNKSAKHNAIINGKVNYINGEGFFSKVENDSTNRFIYRMNSAGEGLNDIAKKCALDIEIFGGFYLNFIPDKLGRLSEIYHLDFNKVRANDDGSQFFYKNDWSSSKEKPKEYPAFNPKKMVPSIFQFKEYRPGLRTYPLPGYVGSINYIESDIEVSKHTLTNAKSGFSVSKLVNFFNGEPAPEMQRDIQKRLEKKFTGSDGSKIMVSFNNDVLKAPTILDLGASDLTKEDFQRVDALIVSNIMAGHQITTPTLFGIAEPGKLGTKNELRMAYEIFNNTYVSNKQRTLEKVFNYIAKLKGIEAELFIRPVDPVGIEFTDTTLLQAAPRSWLLEKMGIDPLKYPDAPVGKDGTGVVPIAQESDNPVNSVLTNLTGRQHQQISRVVRQYTQGKLTKEQASLMLKNGFGFSDDDVNNYLGLNDAKFSADLNEVDVAMMLLEVGENADSFHTVFSTDALFTSNKEVEDFEEVFYKKDVFAVAEKVSTIEASILNLIKKDPKITPKVVSQALNITENYANQIMTDLVNKGLLKVSTEGADAIVVRSLVKDIPPVITEVRKVLPEIMIKYSYEPKAGLKAVINGTRPFCRMMMADKRYFTRQQIEIISQSLGYSLWDRRGGFWNHGKGKETTAYCRHIWKTNIVVKK